MTIAEIVQRGSGHAGHGGAWRVERINGDHSVSPYEAWPVYRLTHYGHHMLTWTENKHGVSVLDMSTGYGSVSDQGGMNTAFRVLGLDYYYSRKGGAQIMERHPRTERM